MNSIVSIFLRTSRLWMQILLASAAIPALAQSQTAPQTVPSSPPAAQTPQPAPQPSDQPANQPSSQPTSPQPSSQPPAATPAAPAASTAQPPAPAAAPPGNTETPAVVVEGKSADTLLGKPVQSASGDDMGRIVDVMVDHTGLVRAAIIDFGGFLGVGTRKIAVDWRVLHFPPDGSMDKIVADLSQDQLRVAPVYKPGEPVVIVGRADVAPPAPATAAPAAPAPSAPVQAAPAQSTPAPAAPAPPAPTQPAPVPSAPAQSAPTQTAPTQTAPTPAPPASQGSTPSQTP